MSPVPVARSSARMPGARRRQRDEPPLPPPILSVRQRDGDEVVPIGDRREQRAHVAALAVGRRDASVSGTRHSLDNIAACSRRARSRTTSRRSTRASRRSPADARLVPMGQVAAALGVTPGTATTMVKALAESGLAEYEPYSGVRLTPAGEKLAGLVLRRHRLVELFLVQVMGMSWAEVHDEAEQLEHVVSERLIERIDEMLGHPTHDPHGDPDSRPRRRDRRAASRQPAHLPARHAAERDAHRRSGSGVPALHRDQRPQAGSAGRGRRRATPPPTPCSSARKDQRRITIGARAASKLLVEADRLSTRLRHSRQSLTGYRAATQYYEHSKYEI